MHEEFNPNFEEDQSDASLEEAQKKHQKMIDYLESEGFIEKTDTKGSYKYTPEGLALMQQRFKEMMNELDF